MPRRKGPLYVMLSSGLREGEPADRLERSWYPAARFLRRLPREGEFDRSWRLFVEVSPKPAQKRRKRKNIGWPQYDSDVRRIAVSYGRAVVKLQQKRGLLAPSRERDCLMYRLDVECRFAVTMANLKAQSVAMEKKPKPARGGKR